MKISAPIDCMIGQCTDVACRDGYIYAIKGLCGEGYTPLSEIYDKKYANVPVVPGSLVILKLNDDKTAVPIATLEGIGNARQIDLLGNTAYITARESGLYIVDIKDPYRPNLLCHYNTVEFATGIAVSGHYAAIGCRNFGIELLDISIPRKPKHLSIIHAGEVQSVFFDGNILYAGSWGERKAVVIDISDALHPKTLCEIPLNGQGDGIFARDGILYAVTGQNARGVKLRSLDDPYFGRGNGFEIYDVKNPAEPKLLSRTQLVDRFTISYYDMWDVNVCYPYAYICHTYNGLFVFDISNPSAPELLYRYQVRFPDDSRFFTDTYGINSRPNVLPFDTAKDKYAPIGGISVIDGMVCIASPVYDLQLLYGDIFHEVTMDCQNLRMKSNYYDYYMPSDVNCHTVNIGSQVMAAAWYGDVLYAACGDDGVEILSGKTYESLGHIDTSGCVDDIKISGDYLYLAEKDEGLSIWKLSENGQATYLSRVKGEDTCVRHTVISGDRRFAVSIVAGIVIAFFDISDPYHPYEVMRFSEAPGLLYGRQLSVECVGGRYAGCFWNGNCTWWFDLSGEKPVRLNEHQIHAMGFNGGITAYSDTLALAVTGGGYTVFNPTESLDFASVGDGMKRIAGFPFGGVPVVYEDRLICAKRMTGEVVVLDISDIRNPKAVMNFTLPGNPDISVVTHIEDKRIMAIPAGHEGVVFMELK